MLNDINDIFVYLINTTIGGIIAVMSYLFSSIRKLKSEIVRLELKMSEIYITKQEFHQFEDVILDKFEEKRKENASRHTEVVNKLADIDDKIFMMLSRKD